MKYVIVMMFDENDADYLKVIVDDKNEKYVDNLVKIWKQLKEDLARLGERRYNTWAGIYDTWANNGKLSLTKEEKAFIDDIIPYSDVGVTLESIEIYQYVSYRRIR